MGKQMDLIFQFAPKNTNRNSALQLRAIKDIQLTLINVLKINQIENILSVNSKVKFHMFIKFYKLNPDFYFIYMLIVELISLFFPSQNTHLKKLLEIL